MGREESRILEDSDSAGMLEIGRVSGMVLAEQEDPECCVTGSTEHDCLSAWKLDDASVRASSDVGCDRGLSDLRG